MTNFGPKSTIYRLIKYRVLIKAAFILIFIGAPGTVITYILFSEKKDYFLRFNGSPVANFFDRMTAHFS